MPKLPRAQWIVVALVGLTALYGCFAFSNRALLAGTGDHLKVLAFAAIACAWILVGVRLGGRFSGRGVGIRVAVFIGACIAAPLVMGWMRSRAVDPVWRELWDTTPVLFFLPVIQGLFADWSKTPMPPSSPTAVVSARTSEERA